MALASVGIMRRWGDTRSGTVPVQREAGQTRMAIRTKHPHSKMPATAELAARAHARLKEVEAGLSMRSARCRNASRQSAYAGWTAIALSDQKLTSASRNSERHPIRSQCYQGDCCQRRADFQLFSRSVSKSCRTTRSPPAARCPAARRAETTTRSRRTGVSAG